MLASGRSHSWPVPYIRSLDGEFQPGQTVFVKGFMLGETFAVNLTTGANVRGNNLDPIAIHISCRANEKAFVVNTFTASDGWGKEERHKLTLKENEEFDLRVRAHEEYFEVFANGKSMFNYNYRIPLTLVNHIYIDGAVELYHVSWEGRYYPIPYEVKIPAMKTGTACYVSGCVNDKAKQFQINLKAGQDHVLHFNPRFNEKVVVRNSSQGGDWGAEERDGDFTFKKDRTFDIILGCTDTGYDIFVDGTPFCTYTHRVPANEINALTIDGDINIQGIHW